MTKYSELRQKLHSRSLPKNKKKMDIVGLHSQHCVISSIILIKCHISKISGAFFLSFVDVEQQTKEMKTLSQLSFENVAINIVASVTAEKLLISKINSEEKLLELGDDEGIENVKSIEREFFSHI